MKSRAELIKAGKIWTVHNHENLPEKTYFEGTKTACIKWLKENNLFRDYKNGTKVRLGMILWEKEDLYDALRADDFNNKD